MKSTITTLLLFLTLFVQSAMAQQWAQQPSFPGSTRTRSASFTVDGKMYIMGGFSNALGDLTDFWEYDISSGTWTQKPDFPGGARYGAVAFAIGADGYIACGSQDGPNYGDLWQYNTASGTWTQKATVPERRREAFAFVIDGKAYLGGGVVPVLGPNQTWNVAMSDLWQYDPGTDAWTARADLPDFLGRQMCVAGTINGKGYVGLGCNVDEDVNYKSFWEYNPVADAWTAKADFPNDSTTDAAFFVYHSELYVVGGVKLPQVSLAKQFQKYTPVTGVWTSVGVFDGGAIAGAVAGGNDTVAFIGTGFDGGLFTRTDFWKFPGAPVVNPNAIGGPQNPGQNTAVIYPNPASGQITVQTGSEIAGLAVYDLTGRLLIDQASEQSNINIEHLSEGIYHLKISYRDGSSGVLKFVKE
jgi:N-acetylneuraminic acid mutarotase